MGLLFHVVNKLKLSGIEMRQMKDGFSIERERERNNRKKNNEKRAAHMSLNSDEYRSVLLAISVSEVERMDQIKWEDFA